MVALHNRKLKPADIFRGILWTDREWYALRDQIEADLKAEGLTEPGLSFAVARRIEDYQRTQPSMRERQQIMSRIYPPKRSPAPPLTEEELAWLIDRLEGVNDPIGLDILDKLRKIAT